MIFTILTAFIYATVALAAPAPIPAAQDTNACALCPEANLAGEALVASSGGTEFVPRFCGFQSNATAAVSPTTICFYNDVGNLFYSSTDLCPTTTNMYSPCPYVG